MERPSLTRPAVVLSTAALLLAACEEPLGLPCGLVGADEVGQIVVSFGADPLRYPRDPFGLDSARITGDTLRVWLQHGGGCERHGYGLVAWNGWLESDPVQAGVLLAHEDRDDPCDALLFPGLRFDLVPLREAYHRDYGAEHGTVVIRLSDPTDPSAPSIKTLTWSF